MTILLRIILGISDMIRKEIIKPILTLVMVCSLLLPSCSTKHSVVLEQTEYHDSIYELEEYLLNDMGDYYRIEEPRVDTDNKIIDIEFDFLSSYIYTGKVDNTIIEVMEDTRIAINTFLLANPDYYLNDGYLIRVVFIESPESHSLSPEIWGRMSNRLFTSSSVEDSLCSVYYNIASDDLLNDNLGFEGIRELDVQNMQNTNLVLSLIDRMPDLEIVNSSLNLIQYYSELRPDIQFV